MVPARTREQALTVGKSMARPGLVWDTRCSSGQATRAAELVLGCGGFRPPDRRGAACPLTPSRLRPAQHAFLCSSPTPAPACQHRPPVPEAEEPPGDPDLTECSCVVPLILYCLSNLWKMSNLWKGLTSPRNLAPPSLPWIWPLLTFCSLCRPLPRSLPLLHRPLPMYVQSVRVQHPRWVPQTDT